MNELRLTCLACGHEWKIGRNAATQKEHEEFVKRHPNKDVPQSALYRCECGWQGTQQYGHAFCERCNKQLTEENIVQDFHAFEKKSKSSGCAGVLLFSILVFFVLALVSCGNQSRPTQEPEPNYDSIANEIMKQIDTPDEEKVLETQSKDAANLDPLVGSYRCKKTKDVYIFYANGTGTFVTGMTESDFTWKRSGKNVVINYEVYGKQKLTFDSKAKTIVEVSESLGKLIFLAE